MSDLLVDTPKVETEILQFGRKRHLVGIFHNTPGATYIAVMWNTGISSRIGAFRGNVAAAEALAAKGYSVLRFDLSQLGESEDPGEAIHFQERSTLDLKDALDAATQHSGINQFILVGLCSSALDAYYFALEDTSNRIRAIFMVDSLVFPTRRHKLGFGLDRLVSVFRWKRFLQRRFARFTKYAEEALPTDYFEGNYPTPSDASRGFQSFLDRGIAIQLIYTGGFTPFYSYRTQFYDMLPGMKKHEKLEILYWKDVDHLFMLREDRERYIASLCNWLDRVLVPSEPLALPLRPILLEAAAAPLVPDAIETQALRPGLDTERVLNTVLTIYNSILAPTQIEADDSFFDFGGTSVLAIRAAQEVGAALSLEIPVVAIYTYIQASSLTQAIARGEFSQETSPSSIESSVTTGSVSSADSSNEPIAIIGMACHVPGAKNIEEFWSMIMDGREGVTHFTRQQLDSSIPLELRQHPQYVPSRGVIEADRFDAPFFKVSRREAMLMDPQQRILIETSWQALEDSGYSGRRSEHKIAVYAGIGANTYLTRNLAQGHFEPHSEEESLALMYNEKDDAAMRVAYLLNLKGPAISVHTACSTSLVAVIEAIKTLRAGGADMAIAGGASVTAPIASGHRYQEGGIFSKDGHCKPFDKDASGTLFSDGAAVVVLKRLSDAVRDQDHIYSVIRGIGTNNDGSEKSSYAAPSVKGQEEAIRDAIATSGIDPATVGYIECHGTGTPIGDPIELEALRRAYHTLPKGFAALGSTKAHIGHLTAAAGGIGLIKAALAIQHAVKPALLHFTEAHPNIRLDRLPFSIPRQNEVWKGIRRAGVSSFGVGGTNSHVILEQAPPHQGKSQASALDPWITLRWSAASEIDATRIKEGLPQKASSDLSYTLSRRAALKYAQASTTLGDSPLAEAAAPRIHTAQKNKLVFVFPGQGSQYASMGLELARTWPRFAKKYFHALDHFKSAHQLDLRIALETDERLGKTQITQTALFAFEWALAESLREAGFAPHAVLGHSLGEITAAAVGGVLTFADAATLVYHRARLMQSTAEGLMTAVRCSRQELEKLLPEGSELAAENTAKGVVASGSPSAITELEARLTAREIAFRRLNASNGFHSSLMDGVLEEFERAIEHLPLRPSQLPLISTVTGKRLSAAEATNRSYWVSQVRKPVLFAEAIGFFASDSDVTFVEIGPRDTLLKFIQNTSSAPVYAALPHRGLSETDAIGLFFSELALGNHAPFVSEEGSLTALRPYPFYGERLWLEPKAAAKLKASVPPQLKKANSKPTPANREFNMTTHPVVKVLAKMLDLAPESIGLDKSWNELGLDSLLLTQWSLKLQRDFGFDVSLRGLQADYPSTKELIAKFAAPLLAPEAMESAGELEGEEGSDQDTETLSLSPDSGGSIQSMQQLMSDQIRLMNRQLDIMQSLIRQGSVRALSSETTVAQARPALHEDLPAERELVKKEGPALVWKTYQTDQGDRRVQVPAHAFLNLDAKGQPAFFVEDPEGSGNYLPVQES